MSNTQHWPILQQLDLDFLLKIRLFMVIGEKGDGVVLTTHDKNVYWFGWMRFGDEARQAKEPIKINVGGDLISMAHGSNHIVLLNWRGSCWAMGLLKGFAIFDPDLVNCNIKFTSMQCGYDHCVALGKDKKVYYWDRYQRNRSSQYEFLLQQVTGLDSHRVVAIACGGYHTLALTDQGEVFGWHTSQQENNHVYSTYPTKISTNGFVIKSIACGRNRSLMLTANGHVFSCGGNNISTYNPLLLKIPVSGLPTITQIATHYSENLWTAMSDDKTVYVLGPIEGGTDVSTPIKFNSNCIFAPFALFTSEPNTPYSIQATPPNRLPLRLAAMFDNPVTSDIQFEVEQKTIHAHRYILQSFSDYLSKLLSETWLPTKPKRPLDPIVIEGYSYSVFYAYLRFLYTGKFQVSQEDLLEFFDLANCYLEEELRQLSLDQLKLSISVQNCSVYYEFANSHQIPEFEQFVVKFVSDHTFQVYGTETYRAMKPELCKKLTIAIGQLKLSKTII